MFFGMSGRVFSALLLALLAGGLSIGATPARAQAADPAFRERPTEPDPRVSLILARALRKSGDSRAAAQIFRPLASLRDATPELRLEFAQTLIEAGLFDEAIGILAAVAPGSKQEGAAQFELGRIQLAMNQPARALASIQRSVGLAPQDPRFLIAQGVALDRLGRHPEAQISYRAALSVSPQSVAARSDLALSLALIARYDEAIDILTPIARSASATPLDRQNLAFVYGLKGDNAAALALGRRDLDEASVQGNQTFFAALVRDGR